MIGWFSALTIVLVVAVVFIADTFARWYRGNEWRRRARRGDDE